MSEHNHTYITGDCHGNHSIRKFSSINFEEGKSLTKDDYVIIAGDFGLIWHPEDSVEDKSDKYWRDWLDAKPWTTLFVDGNHENAERINNYPVEEWHGGKIHKVGKSIYHLMRGQVFDIHSKKFFVCGGARSHDIEYRTPYKTWWPEEVPSEEERKHALDNLEKHGWKVDCVVTHDGPLIASDYLNRTFGDWSRHNDEFEEWLDSEISKKLDFGTWYFGHHHIDLDMWFESFVPGKMFRAIYHDILEIK